MRLYANENFPLASVIELRRLGHDVLTTVEAGAANLGTPDDEVLGFAIAEQRAVLTLNRRDFVRLSRAPGHFGIIVCSADPDHERLARRVDEQIAGVESLRDQLIRINRPG